MERSTRHVDLLPGERVIETWAASIPGRRLRWPRASGDLVLTDRRVFFDPYRPPLDNPIGAGAALRRRVRAAMAPLTLDTVESVTAAAGPGTALRVLGDHAGLLLLIRTGRGGRWVGRAAAEARDVAVTMISTAARGRH